MYKSVPAPRQLEGDVQGAADAAQRGEHPLSGSEPALTELAGRLGSVSAQVTVSAVTGHGSRAGASSTGRVTPTGQVTATVCERATR